MARVPTLGMVKTRLAATLGAEAALAAYRALGAQTLATVRRSTASSIAVAYTPAGSGAAEELRAWLGHDIRSVPQRDGDLGDRMSAAVGDALARLGGRAHVLIVGTDCPWLTEHHIDHAFEALVGHDVVLGPSLDGGYYLIGMGQHHRAVFADVPWSSAHTRRVTLERIRDAGLSVHLLSVLRDVDEAADWDAWLAAGRSFGTQAAGQTSPAPAVSQRGEG